MDYKTKKTNGLVSITKIRDDLFVVSQQTFDKYSGEPTEPQIGQTNLENLYAERTELEKLLKDKNDMIKDVEALISKARKID